MDVRTVISAHAQFLKIFCRNSQRAISYSLIGLRSSSVISNELMSESLLDIQIQIQKEYLQSASGWHLSVLIDFYKLVTTSNHMIMGLGTNAQFYIPTNQSSQATVVVNAYQVSNSTIPCYCLGIDSCVTPGQIYQMNKFSTFGFYNFDFVQGQVVPVDGIRVGCFALDSVLSSTLQCYYNRSCLDLLVQNSTLSNPLHLSSANENTINETVEFFVESLFIKQWFFNTSYSDYYSQCAPNTCVYSFNRRNNFFIIFITVFSALGGLNTILRVLIPTLLKTFDTVKEKRRSQNMVRQSEMIPWLQRPSLISQIKKTWSWLWKKIYLLNLFDSQSNEPLREHYERHRTRLYISSMLISFMVLVFYSALTEETKTYTVLNPSQAIYDRLYKKYGDIIECTCDKIAIPYSTFLNIEASYHQICSSGFVSPSLIMQLSLIREDISLYRADFLHYSPDYFQWLMTLCILSQTVFTNQFIALKSELLVNAKLLSRFTFAHQAEQLIINFISDVQLYFARSITQSRTFLAILQPLSFTYTLPYNLPIIHASSKRQVRIEPSNFFANCSCTTNPTTCSMNAAFYSLGSSSDEFVSSFVLDGVRLACNSIESVLQSNLACWYQDDCYLKVNQKKKNRFKSFNVLV